MSTQNQTFPNFFPALGAPVHETAPHAVIPAERQREPGSRCHDAHSMRVEIPDILLTQNSGMTSFFAGRMGWFRTESCEGSAVWPS